MTITTICKIIKDIDDAIKVLELGSEVVVISWVVVTTSLVVVIPWVVVTTSLVVVIPWVVVTTWVVVVSLKEH